MTRITVISNLLVFSASILFSEGANILFLLPIATKSHKNVFDALILALAERGHNITVVAPLTLKTPKVNIKEIVPVSFSEINPSVTSGNPFEKRKEGKIGFFLSWNSTFLETGCDKLYRNEEIKGLIKSGPGSFDVILVNGFMNQCVLGIVHKLETPHIYLVTMPGMNLLVGKTGLYMPPSFVPCSFAAFGDRMNFKERVLNFAAEYFMIIMGRLYWTPYLSKMYQDHLGANTPTIDEIDKNVSLILMNSHFTLTYPRPLLPDVVEVGGMHCRQPKPLPEELETFLSGAKEGFIVFSLGSIVQAKDMPPEVSKAFMNVFSKLKQRVIWKWEGDIPENVPQNVKLSKWLPQQDILGHPNIRIFMTHGGLLSTQEAVFHGVPLIGFPIFADQDLNMMKAEKAGFALNLEIGGITEETLEKTINRMLTDKSFMERAKQLSAAYTDQPMRPIETAIYWVEYIIRYKGAMHLRSAARNLHFIAYHSIDVVLFLASCLLLTLWLIKKMLTICLKCLFGNRTNKLNKKVGYLHRKKNK